MTSLATRPDPGVDTAPVVARPADPRDPAARLTALCDPGSAVPLRQPDGSGVLAVQARIDGATVVAYCTDAAVSGGAMGSAGCRAIVGAIDTAVRLEVPVVGLWHSGGARLPEGVEALDGVGRVFAAMVRASGRIPQVSVVLGPAAGGAAYGPALTDLVVMAPAGRVFVTGPDVIRSVTGEEVTQEALGGPVAHATRSGVAHVVASSANFPFASDTHYPLQEDDVLDEPLDFDGGSLTVPRTPGLGVSLSTERLELLARRELRQSVFYDDVQGEAPRVGQIL